MASALSQNVSKPPVRAAMALSALGAIVVLGIAPGLAACGIAAAIFWVIRQVTVLRVGGYTGDVAGALIEIVETAVLLIAVLVAA